MTKLDIILLAIAIYMVFKLIKEMMYIRLYAFMLRLQANGKLRPDDDPNGVVKQTKIQLKKNQSKYF